MSFPFVAPADIRDYAKSLGWSLLPEAVKDRLFVLTHPELRPRQIVIPMDTSAPDYLEAVRLAVQKLADLHGLPLADVFMAVQTAREDTLRYRILSTRREVETLPLAFAAAFLQGTVQMLMASACTVLKPQVHHPRLHRNEAQQVVDHARLHQTERGSFVLNVSCPMNALDEKIPSPLHEENLPFVRMTTLAMNQALQELINGVKAGKLDELVARTKSSEAPLLSSNFCDAVTQLYDEGVRNDVELSFFWAANTPPPRARTVRDHIRIKREYFDRIAEVQHMLRPAASGQGRNFVGTVERLKGHIDKDGRRSGEVILSISLTKDETTLAKVELSPDDYEKASQAHLTNGAHVKVRGRLHPGRQPRLLSDIRHFEVIMPPPPG